MAATTTALIYTRVSTDDQAREGLSLDAQLAECRRYAAQKGWVLGNEYQDILSGKRDDRPAYQRLLRDVRGSCARDKGKKIVVLVFRLDRFGRRVLERVRCREELKTLGVATHSVRDNGEVSDFHANILASMAEEEVRVLGERVRAVRQHISAQGWAPVGRVAWGYRWREATDEERGQGAPRRVLDIDPDTAPFVRQAFERIAAGESIRTVARWVASLPETARGGRALGFSNVRQSLEAPVYVSRPARDDGGDVLEGGLQRWPAIIPDDLWTAVQRRLEQARRLPNQASGGYHLVGFLRCPVCGARMGGWPRKRDQDYYRCNQVPAGACSYTAPLRPIDEQVLAAVSTLVDVAASAHLRGPLRRAWDRLRAPTPRDEPAARIATLQREIERAKKRLTDAAILLVDGAIDRAAYDALRERITAELDAATAEIERVRGAKVEQPNLPPLDDVLRALGGWHGALHGPAARQRRDVLDALVGRVVPERVSRGKYVANITWTPLGLALRSLMETPA